MYTQCPDCSTVFRVTADALRVAQGRVRCGICSSGFNALENLSEAPVPRAMDPPPEDTITVEELPGTEFIELSGGPDGGPDGALAGPADEPAVEADADTREVGDDTLVNDLLDSIPDAALEFHGTAEDLEKLFIPAAPFVPGAQAPAGEVAQAIDEIADRDLSGIVVREEVIAWPESPGDAFDPGNPAHVAALLASSRAGEATTGEGDLDRTDEYRALVIGEAEAARLLGEEYPEEPVPAPDGAAGGPEAAAAEAETAPASGDDGQPDVPAETDAAAAEAARETDLPAETGAAAAEAAHETDLPAETDAAAAEAAYETDLPAETDAAAAEAAYETDLPAETDAAAMVEAGPTEDTGTTGTVHEEAAADAVPPDETPLLIIPEALRRGPSATAADELAAPLDLGETPPRRWPVAAVAAVLALVLGLQAVHHWRDGLARHPAAGPWVLRAYQALGMTLAPPVDLAAFELRQLGAASDPGQAGRIKVRASIVNHAPFAQPFPVLRLTLQDRFGSTIGARNLQPDEYLPGAGDASGLLGASQRADAEVVFVDPGRDAVGFELDVCMAGDAGLRCTADLPRTAP